MRVRSPDKTRTARRPQAEEEGGQREPLPLTALFLLPVYAITTLTRPHLPPGHAIGGCRKGIHLQEQQTSLHCLRS